MRPKAHLQQQKPWQRKAFQYAAYAFWPMVLLWVLFAYPGGSREAAIKRTHAEVRPVSRDTKMLATGGASDTPALQTALSDFDTAGSDTDWGDDANEDDLAEDRKREKKGSTQQQQQQLEHVATVGAKGGSDGSGRVYSSCRIYAVRNGSGQLAKFYYKFINVRLTKKTLYFFMPPGMRKPEELWVDFISGNATAPRLPTMIVIKGEVQRQKWFYLPVKYTLAPSNCAAWTEKPTYFLQVRYSYNIWHTWNEGLMGAFQTLREQGLLPLVQVDADGNMREVTEGLTASCPLVWDVERNTTVEEEDCVQRTGVVTGTHCDIKNQAWCKPGVVSYRRYDGPIILPYTAASVMNRWAQVYDAMTTDVRDFSLVDGHCFRAFIVGKSNTLNYYQAMNMTDMSNPFIRERVEGMAVFKEFVSTAQREFVAAERAKNPAAVEFRGYVNPKMERLRKGIGPEDIELVDYIAPTEVPGLLREELPQLKEMWAKRRAEIARIEAMYGKGAKVVDLQQGGDTDSGGAAGKKGGAVEDEDSDAGGHGKARHGGDDDDGDEAASAGISKGKKRGLQHGEGRHRRKLREPANRSDSSSSSSAGVGEGARRRLPKHRGRALQQEGGSEAAGTFTAAAGGSVDEDSDDSEPLLGDATADPAGDAADMVAGRGAGAQPEVGAAGEEAELAQQTAEREAALKAMPPIVKRSDEFTLEPPRPVVAYMSRNFFSRGVLNEHDILRYILANYNVTVRVTTFEEPLLEAMELLQHADVVIGMHGAGWTNGMFVKHGAVAVQMFPYGWRLPDNSTIRGYNYREIVLASECRYFEWESQRWDYAFFRRIDFNKRVKMEYVLHPDPHGPHPVDGWPGNPWIYQNTYVDMAHFGPYVDRAMATAGIPRVAEPIPVTLN